MTITKIYFEQLFPTGNFSNVRMGMEISMEENDVVLEAYDSAKKLVNASFKALNPDLTPTITDYHTGETAKIQEVQVEKIKDRVEAMIADMNKCVSLEGPDGLLSYKLAAYNTTDFKLREAYDLKFIQLQSIINK